MPDTISIPNLQNEPLLDFSDREFDAESRIKDALKEVRAKASGGMLPHFVAGVPRYYGEAFARENPSCLDETVGVTKFASKETVRDAVEHISESSTAREWARMPLRARAAYFGAVAQRLREQRFFFIALMMLEVGKQAPLADAEVCEAIDLLEHYAAHAKFIEELGNKMLRSPLGEKNSVLYRPYGPRTPICASIQPWNFPLAISAGPAAAALLCGHSVLYKPAEQSSITGYFLSRTFYEAGIPSDIFHFLPGNGEEVGRELVENPRINGVVFTGSLSVRRAIRDSIAQFNKEKLPSLQPEARWEKRAYALESGGKNAMIISTDADPDRAIEDVVESFAGFAGERCSALSRLILVDETGSRFREFLKRLKARVESLPIGSPEEPQNIVGPLIDREAYERVLSFMAVAEKEGKVLAKGVVPAELNGHFLPPMLVEETAPFVSPSTQEEIFGPFLSVLSVRTFDEALAHANRSGFALTFGAHTRDPELSARACREADAGNIYLRKKITGAVPGRQQFGGGKESGGGSKAGDYTYLLPFLHQVHVSENTMQCGIPME